VNTASPGTQPTFFTVVKNPSQARLSYSARLRANHVVARLVVLQRMGRAESAGPGVWHLRNDFTEVLKAMQRTRDRQKTLAAHGVPMSDERLQIAVLDVGQFETVAGRILVHGQEEQSGRNYLMLEGTDAKIHFIYYTPEIEAARNNGGLRAGCFVKLRRIAGDRQTRLAVHDLGDAEKVLANRRLMGEMARDLMKRGIVPSQDGWGGWLGRYQAALESVANELVYECDHTSARSHLRNRDQARGR
jgi:hypothetical protein